MDAGVTAAGQEHWFDGWQSRKTVRVCMIRATGHTSPGIARAEGSDVAKYLDFGRLSKFVSISQDALPRVLSARQSDSVTWHGARSSELAGMVERCREWVFDVPGGEICSVRTFDVATKSVQELNRFMEDLYYEEMNYEASSWTTWEAGAGSPWNQGSALTLTQEAPYHQLVYIPDDWPLLRDVEPEDEFQILQRLIYRADLDADARYTKIVRPSESNRRPGRGAALGPFVSVLWGQQDYVENFALLSAVSLVGVQGQLRRTQRTALSYMQELGVRREKALKERPIPGNTTLEQERAWLSVVQGKLTDFEVELTFGVDSAATMMPLIPSMRVDNYHRALYDALDLTDQTTRASRMLQRLRSAVESESNALSSVDASRAALRSRRWALTVGLLTVAVAPLSLLLAFFGVTASEVDPDRSIFDWEAYWLVYASIVGFILLIAIIHLAHQFLSRGRLEKAIRSARGSHQPDAMSSS